MTITMNKKTAIAAALGFALVGCSSMMASMMNGSMDMLIDEAFNGKYPLPKTTNIAWNNATTQSIQRNMECDAGISWQDSAIKQIFPLTRSKVSNNDGSVWVASAIAPAGFTVYGLPVSKIQIAMTDSYKDGNYTRVQRYRAVTTASVDVVDAKLEQARQAKGGEKLRVGTNENNVMHVFTTSSSKNSSNRALTNIDCTVNIMNKNPLPSLN